MAQDWCVFPVWALALLVILVLSVLWSYLPRWKRSLSYGNLPPGPFCWPILGYLPVLHPSKSHLSLQKLSEKYGSIFSLHVGNRYVVVLNSFEAVKEAYSREEFLGRPKEALQLHPEQESVLDVEGAVWKEQRRFILSCFRQLGVGSPEFESFIMSQVSDVIAHLRCQDSVDVNAHSELELALNNTIFHMTYRKLFDKDHPMIRFLSQFNVAFKVTLAVGAFKTFFPWLGALLGIALRSVRTTLDKMDDLIMKQITEHRETLNPNEPRDMVDHFLLQMNKHGPNTVYNMSSLLGNIKILFTAATDTTRVTLIWFLMSMAAYPQVQDKVQKEIDSVLGREREPRHADRVQMPYTEASICESMRIRNIIHLNVFRKTSSDVNLLGFDIPKDTIIIQNMTSLFTDPSLWERPEVFDPSRFLSKDGSKAIIPESFMPLSFGKRNCVGEKIAGIQNFLYSVALLQRFRILPPDGGVNMDIKTVFSNEQAHPFLRFKWRE